MGNGVFQYLAVRDYGSSSDTSSRFDVDDEDDSFVVDNDHRKGILKQAAGKRLEVSEVSLLLSRAWTVGRGKAVEVLDTLGSSMTNLNPSRFALGTTRGYKISILALEVANTIVNGATLMQSLSKQNIEHLKEVVLPSEDVQHLESKDMKELLRIAASDKREEFKVFSGEVVRFGNHCKDRLWYKYNLNRSFEKFEQEVMMGLEVSMQKQLKVEAETAMQCLMTMVRYTAELYHKLHALDRFEQEYRLKLQEENYSPASQRRDSIAILREKLKIQRKHIRNLKKKSLWSKDFEEVMTKLVVIMQFLHLEIHVAFGSAGIEKPVQGSQNNHQRLGPAGLALHYANIITQIDTIVSGSSCVPPNARDNLYQGLPPSIQSALRFKLRTLHVEEELTVPQIKAEMEKTLYWLVPIASNTIMSHLDILWLGGYGNTGSGVKRIDTLHHADKEKTEACILELVVWLHHLISQSKLETSGGMITPIESPIHSPTHKTISMPTDKPNSSFSSREKWLSKHTRLSKSNSNFTTVSREIFHIRRFPSLPVIDFDIDKVKALDVIDGVDTL